MSAFRDVSLLDWHWCNVPVYLDHCRAPTTACVWARPLYVALKYDPKWRPAAHSARPDRFTSNEGG